MNREADVILARKGNKDAFVRIIKEVEIPIYRVAKAFLKTDADCADAIQEAILKAYKYIHTLREPTHFKTWIIRIVINECKMVLKLRSKVVPMEGMHRWAAAGDDFEPAELREVVDALEEELRTVVVLYYYESFSIKETADALEIPEGTVKSRLSRARALLAHWLGDRERREEHGQRR